MIILDVTTGALGWAIFEACWVLNSELILDLGVGRGVVNGWNLLIGVRCLGSAFGLAGTEVWVLARTEDWGLDLLGVDTWVCALWLADGSGLCAGILDLCLEAGRRLGAGRALAADGRFLIGAGRDLDADGRLCILALGWGSGLSLKDNCSLLLSLRYISLQKKNL